IFVCARVWLVGKTCFLFWTCACALTVSAGAIPDSRRPSGAAARLQHGTAPIARCVRTHDAIILEGSLARSACRARPVACSVALVANSCIHQFGPPACTCSVEFQIVLHISRAARAIKQAVPKLAFSYFFKIKGEKTVAICF